MLSQKLQDDLMTAYQKVYEEKRGHAAGSDDTEKQASQLASDVRYKAKGKIPEGASEEEKKKIFLQILGASPAPNVVKAMAKEKLLGEEVVHEKYGLGMIKNLGQSAGKLDRRLGTKTFAKNQAKRNKEIGDRLVGKSALGRVVRAGVIGASGMAIGGKIEADAEKKREERTAKIRRQPNFTTSDAYSSYNLKLDHTPDGELIDEMKQKPKQTKNPQNMALPKGVKSGVNYQNMAQSYVPVGNIFNEKKLDAVGAEDKDIDNDGDHDSTDKYLLKRRKAIGKAIAKKRGRVKEGFSAWRIDLDFNEQVKK